MLLESLRDEFWKYNLLRPKYGLVQAQLAETGGLYKNIDGQK
jgi:hypothetical protein